jgi:hypothetical protein
MDMDSIRRENEKVPAIGNMKVNARGDQLTNGIVSKTADQIARENHRIQSTVVSTGLKGPIQESVAEKPAPAAPTATKTREVELPSGDIVIENTKE